MRRPKLAPYVPKKDRPRYIMTPSEERGARVLPRMGEQPVLEAGRQERPTETPNPILASVEPFSFPTARDLMPARTHDSVIPRRVVEAEIDEILEWGLPRFLDRFPRCTPESVRPMLLVGVRGGRFNFVRTGNACGLFCAEVTPWEPLLTVYEVFVVSKGPGVRDGAGVGPLEVPNIYRAGALWANEIGACGYRYGSSTGADIEPIATRIGHDVKEISYFKRTPIDVREFGHQNIQPGWNGRPLLAEASD